MRPTRGRGSCRSRLCIRRIPSGPGQQAITIAVLKSKGETVGAGRTGRARVGDEGLDAVSRVGPRDHHVLTAILAAVIRAVRTQSRQLIWIKRGKALNGRRSLRGRKGDEVCRVGLVPAAVFEACKTRQLPAVRNSQSKRRRGRTYYRHFHSARRTSRSLRCRSAQQAKSARPRQSNWW